MNDSTNDRKIEHIRVIEGDRDTDRRKYYFDDVHLIHRALPEISPADVDSSVRFLGKELSFPLLISSMTGGDHEVVRTINHNLAAAAEATGVAMGVGSQRVMFDHPAAKQSFNIRPHAPTTILFANLGGVQLNKGFTIDHCREAVKIVDADALYFHLNPLQEAIQPEGDTDFRNLAVRIRGIANNLEVPVILKEVGAGFSKADADLFHGSSVRHIDVAGTGGISWSRIEHHRNAEAGGALGLAFQDWGIPTPVALRRLEPYRDHFTLIASGGIRSGIDMAKAIVLGASLCGMASPFLKPATESVDAVIAVIERVRREFVTSMFLLGMRQVQMMVGNDLLLLPSEPGGE